MVGDPEQMRCPQVDLSLVNQASYYALCCGKLGCSICAALLTFVCTVHHHLGLSLRRQRLRGAYPYFYELWDGLTPRSSFVWATYPDESSVDLRALSEVWWGSFVGGLMASSSLPLTIQPHSCVPEALVPLAPTNTLLKRCFARLRNAWRLVLGN